MRAGTQGMQCARDFIIPCTAAGLVLIMTVTFKVFFIFSYHYQEQYPAVCQICPGIPSGNRDLENEEDIQSNLRKKKNESCFILLVCVSVTLCHRKHSTLSKPSWAFSQGSRSSQESMQQEQCHHFWCIKPLVLGCFFNLSFLGGAQEFWVGIIVLNIGFE